MTVLQDYLVDQVKTGMKEAGLSQRKLAALVGVESSYVSMLLSGTRSGSIETWDALLFHVGRRDWATRSAT